MSNKKTLVDEIMKSNLDNMSYDTVRFYEGKKLVRYTGDRRKAKWGWVRDELNKLSVDDLEIIQAHCE